MFWVKSHSLKAYKMVLQMDVLSSLHDAVAPNNTTIFPKHEKFLNYEVKTVAMFYGFFYSFFNLFFVLTDCLANCWRHGCYAQGILSS